MRIPVPAGRRIQFFDEAGNALPVPLQLHLTREIELPDPEVRAETPAQVVANRVGVTGALFGIALGAAVLLGASRD